MIKLLQVTLFLLALVCCCSFSSAMLYKRNQQEKFEADLVPVSSTVIPLTVLQVSYGENGKPSEEYKAAYLRKLQKQIQLTHAKANLRTGSSDAVKSNVGVVTTIDDSDVIESPDTLITVKSKQHTGEATKAKVKGITNN